MSAALSRLNDSPDEVTLFRVVTLRGRCVALDVHREAAAAYCEAWNDLERRRCRRRRPGGRLAVVIPTRYSMLGDEAHHYAVVDRDRVLFRSTSIADCAAYRSGTGSRTAEIVCVREVLAPVCREGGAA